MQIHYSIKYEQVLDLVNLMPYGEKKRLITEIKKNLIENSERNFGKYDGYGSISNDFNEPIEEFQE